MMIIIAVNFGCCLLDRGHHISTENINAEIAWYSVKTLTTSKQISQTFLRAGGAATQD